MTRFTPLRAAALAASAVVLVAVAACDDKPENPTAPTSAPVAAVVDAPAPQAGAGVSTICLSYMTKQSVAREKLANMEKEHASTREALETRLEKLDAMVADVCH